MRVLITGASGTVGTALRSELTDHDVTPWDRHAVAPHDSETAYRFVREGGFDQVFHLAVASTPSGIDNEGWRINVEWPEAIARACADSKTRLLFTSTAMVFSNDATGPFTPDTVPDARGGYGFEKHQAESRIRDAHPDTVVVRLGWQIGTEPGSNNMIDFFANNVREHGEVQASTRWLPACSFLPDTAATLAELASADGGIYHLDANERWSFFDIASELSALHENAWPVTPTEDFVYDQRLIDERVRISPLNQRLPGLGLD